jgi:hypothetical protein
MRAVFLDMRFDKRADISHGLLRLWEKRAAHGITVKQTLPNFQPHINSSGFCFFGKSC